MKKYYVIAKRWFAEHKEVREFVAGEFDNFMCASIFKDAYNEHYSTTAYIKEVDLTK